MSTLINCPFCESTRLTEQDEIAEFNDRKNGVRLPYYKVLTECLDCSERFESPTQRLENGKRIAEARSVARGAPTAAEIRKLRKDWGMTIAEAGALFGGGEIAFAKYEKGEIVPVQSMSKLLRLAIANVIQPETLQALIAGTIPEMKAASARPIANPIMAQSAPKRYPTHLKIAYSGKSSYVEANATTVAMSPDSAQIQSSVLTESPLFSTAFNDRIYEESTRKRTQAGASNK